MSSLVEPSSNYTYDNIGNIVADASTNATMTWNREGKVLSVTHAAGSSASDLVFKYDPNGRRIYKQSTGKTSGAPDPTKVLYTYYAYDGSGNVMPTYDRVVITGGYNVRQVDATVYGSGRLGIVSLSTPILRSNLNGTAFANFAMNTEAFNRQPAQKMYELKDHLGNVRTTISGVKFGIDKNADGILDFYTAFVMTENDYYPFGMLIQSSTPGTITGYRFNGMNDYRFGYNGKPMDTDWNGDGAMYDYGFRIYDPRICKFLSVDPLAPSYPWYTPYQFAGNTPIMAVDLDGLEEKVSIYMGDSKEPVFTVLNSEDKDYPNYAKATMEQFDLHGYGIDVNYNQILKEAYGRSINQINNSQLALRIKDGTYTATVTYNDNSIYRKLAEAEQVFYHDIKGAAVGGMGYSNKYSFNKYSFGTRFELYQTNEGYLGLNSEIDFSVSANLINKGGWMSWDSNILNFTPKAENNFYLFIKKNPFPLSNSKFSLDNKTLTEGSITIPVNKGAGLKLEGNSAGTYRFGVTTGSAGAKFGVANKTTLRFNTLFGRN